MPFFPFRTHHSLLLLSSSRRESLSRAREFNFLYACKLLSVLQDQKTILVYVLGGFTELAVVRVLFGKTVKVFRPSVQFLELWLSLIRLNEV